MNSMNTLWTLSRCLASFCAFTNKLCVVPRVFAHLPCKKLLSKSFWYVNEPFKCCFLFPIQVILIQMFQPGFIVLDCGIANHLILLSRYRNKLDFSWKSNQQKWLDFFPPLFFMLVTSVALIIVQWDRVMGGTHYHPPVVHHPMVTQP